MRTPFERLQDLYLRVFDSEFLRRIVRNSSYLVSATVISAGLGMIQGIFQYRVLDLVGVGLLTAMGAFTNVLNRLTSFRIDELVIRYVRLYQERGQVERAAAVSNLAGILELLGSLVAFLLIVVLAPFRRAGLSMDCMRCKGKYLNCEPAQGHLRISLPKQAWSVDAPVA